jgi:hypothetical protein
MNRFLNNAYICLNHKGNQFPDSTINDPNSDIIEDKIFFKSIKKLCFLLDL